MCPRTFSIESPLVGPPSPAQTPFPHQEWLTAQSAPPVGGNSKSWDMLPTYVYTPPLPVSSPPPTTLVPSPSDIPSVTSHTLKIPQRYGFHVTTFNYIPLKNSLKFRNFFSDTFLFTYHWWLHMCVFSVLRTKRYDWIIRWWSSDLGQRILKSLTMLLVITTFILAPRPTCLSRSLYRFCPPPLLPPPVSSGLQWLHI